MSRWRNIQVGELVEPVESWNPLRANQDEEFDYIDLSAVDQSTKTILAPRKVACCEAPSRARQLVAANDVLVSTVRPNLNGVASVPAELDQATASTGFCVLRARSNLLGSSYLFHWVKSPQFVTDMVKKATGANYPAVSDKIIFESQIPVPPLPEQIRIAAILDQADALRVKRREALAQLDSLTQSIFIEMFGDPTHNPFSFPLLPISGLVSNGRSKLVHGDENIWNLNLDQIEPNTGRVLQKVRSAPDKLGTSTFAFETGTVLYSKLRPYLNKVVVADEDGVATTELVPLKCIETLTKPAFLAYFLRSKRFVDFATETVAGAKMPRMMMDAFWSYKLPMPPVSLQDTFAEKIELIEKQRGAQLQSATEFDNLFASLQHRAFHGEL